MTESSAVRRREWWKWSDLIVTITSFTNCQSGTDAAFFMLTPHRQAEIPTRASIAAEGCIGRQRARPYAGSIDYFQSADSLPAVVGVWKRWCTGGVTVHQIPGGHHEVILGANASAVANIFRGIRADRAPQGGCPAESADRRQA